MQLIGRVENIVLKGAKREAERILEEARSRASSIIEDAKRQVPSILSYYTKRAHRWIELERQRRLGLAQLKVNEAFLNAEYEILRKVLENLREEIVDKLKDESTYKGYMENLLREIFSENSFEEPVVRVNPSDVKLVESLLGEMGIGAKVQPDESVEYGIVVEDGERGFVIYNTLDTRLERVSRIISEEIRKLWEE